MRRKQDIRKTEHPLFDLKVQVTPSYSVLVHRRIVFTKSKLFEMLIKREQELLGTNEILSTLSIQLPIENETLEKDMIQCFDTCLDLMYGQQVDMSTGVIRMAMFLMMDPDEMIIRWSSTLPETLSPSDVEVIKSFVQDESIGPSNESLQNLISYYGKSLAQQVEFPQEILSTISLYGDENIDHENIDLFEEDDDYKVIRSQHVNLGLITRNENLKFEAFGIEWTMNRFYVSYPEELVKIYVSEDYQCISTNEEIQVRVLFLVFKRDEKIVGERSRVEKVKPEMFKRSIQAAGYISNGLCTCFAWIEGKVRVSVVMEEVVKL